MPRGRYKTYLFTHSTAEMSKTTAFHRNKSKWESHSDASTSYSPSLQIDSNAGPDARNPMEMEHDGYVSSENRTDERTAECIFEKHESGGSENEEENISYSNSFESTDDDGEHEVANLIGDNRKDDLDIVDENVKNEASMSVADIPDNLRNLTSINDARDFNLKNTLCPCTDTTVGEALLTILSIGLRHSLPWTALVDIAQGINLLWNTRVIPDTKFLLQKYFPSHIDTAKYHLYCALCKDYLGERRIETKEITCSCGHKTVIRNTHSYFLEFNVEKQLKILLENPAIAESLKDRLNRQKEDETAWEDIYDGDMYQKYVSSGLLSDWRNLSCTLNTDGCQHAKSSKLSVWPIYMKINEIPAHLRGKHLLAGLWVDKTEPNMNLFLKPFVEQANRLMSEGFTWTMNQEIIESKLFFICCSVDSPCRCAMLSMKQFTGFYGCTYCYHPAETIDNTRKYTVLAEIPLNRTDDEIKSKMVEMHRKSNETQGDGILGPSVMMNLKNFDLVHGMPPDYMHACLLGVTRQFTKMILSASGKKYYIGTPLKSGIITKRLTTITPPSIIHRTPRPLSEIKLWKAAEWQTWLLFYSLPCLEGILASKYIKHWSQFVAAIAILSKNSITPKELKHAEALLEKFVKQYQKYYGKYEMKYNIHLLLHLCGSVQNWGPLWTQNTFDFENQNRLLLQLRHSPRKISMQIANRLLSFQNIISFSGSINASLKVHNFCKSLQKNNVRWYHKCDHHVVLGKGKRHNLTDEEKHIVRTANKKCTSFSQILVNNNRYTTKSYTEKYCTEVDNSVVLLDDGEIGIISNILQIVTETNDVVTVVLISQVRIKENFGAAHIRMEIMHIKECELTGRLTLYEPINLMNPCLLMSIAKKMYTAEIPLGCMCSSRKQHVCLFPSYMLKQ